MKTANIKKAYQPMLHDVEINQNTTNWASKLNDLLTTLGFYEVWLNQGVGNKNVFLSEVKVMLHDNCVQNWNTRINESSGANFFQFF